MITVRYKVGGLKRRPYETRTESNSVSLESCYNIVGTPDGVRSYYPVQFPFGSTAPGMNFPNPKLVFGNTWKYLLDSNQIYQVDPNTTPWSLYPITVYDSVTGNPASITIGSEWQFVDLHDAWFAYNGNTSLYYLNTAGIYGNVNKVYLSPNVKLYAGCSYRGRVIFGGFDPNYAWDPQWETDFNNLIAKANLATTIVQDFKFRPNMIWWSSIGATDALFLFRTTSQNFMEYGFIDQLTTQYSFANDDAYIFDLLKRNEMGFAPMPFSGTVRVLKPLGGQVVVYGDDGICGLFLGPNGQIGITDHQLGELSTVGIYPSCVGGDDKAHLFLDNSGGLWLLLPNEVHDLGYHDVFSPLLGTRLVCSHTRASTASDGSKIGTFIISNGYRTFVFNANGLTEVDQLVTSQRFFWGNSVGYCTTTDRDTTLRLVTEPLELINPDPKTVVWVRFGFRAGTSALKATFKARLHYRTDRNGDFTTTQWVTLNDQYAAPFRCTGTEFKVELSAPDYRADIHLRDIHISFHSNRKVGVGGVFTKA